MRPDDILSLYSFNSLRTMARTREYPLSSPRRPELIAGLAGRLLEPSELRRMIATLAAGERAVLDVIVQAGGRLPQAAFAEALLERGVIDKVGPPRVRETIDRIAPTTRNFEELCARLTARGLLFSEPHMDGTLAGLYDLGPGAVLFAPGPVLDALQQLNAENGPTPPAQTVAVDVAPLPAAQPAVRGRLIVQPSYSLLLLPPLDQATLERLNAVAEQVRLAEVAEYKLTQAALYAAVLRGVVVADVIRFLEERGAQPLPQNVRYTVEAWSSAFEQVRILQQAVLLEGSAAILDQLQATPALLPFVVRRLGPTRLLLAEANEVERVLAGLGEIPLTINYLGEVGPLLQVTADGLITQSGVANHLLLPLALRRIAEPLADGAFQLTPERVRTAVKGTPDGLTGLIKWLRLYAGELPAELVARLKLWSLPVAEVAFEQPLLLRLPHDVLADLRAFPELAPLLADEYRPSAALVRIAPEARAELSAALRARGLALDDELQSAS
ncbi:MAG: helicase-associated domain-containing protein [Chloroflexota bacterium]|nr:helicase-associated domain-containing protein [Chloroflexota bacterium]